MVYPDFSKGSKEVDLGEAAAFTEFPTEVEIDGNEFYLSQDKDGTLHLLSSLCPHSWGQIYLDGTCFTCPSHGWRFEFGEGICINGPIARMYEFEVTTRDGRLFAEIPDKPA